MVRCRRAPVRARPPPAARPRRVWAGVEDAWLRVDDGTRRPGVRHASRGVHRVLRSDFVQHVVGDPPPYRSSDGAHVVFGELGNSVRFWMQDRFAPVSSRAWLCRHLSFFRLGPRHGVVRQVSLQIRQLCYTMGWGGFLEMPFGARVPVAPLLCVGVSPNKVSRSRPNMACPKTGEFRSTFQVMMISRHVLYLHVLGQARPYISLR